LGTILIYDQQPLTLTIRFNAISTVPNSSLYRLITPSTVENFDTRVEIDTDDNGEARHTKKRAKANWQNFMAHSSELSPHSLKYSHNSWLRFSFGRGN